MTTHTPTPWIYEHDEEEATVKIWAGSAIEERHTGCYESAGEMTLYDSCYGESKSDAEMLANAALIVHRVNGWDEQQARIDELVGVLEKLLHHIDNDFEANGVNDALYDAARKALTRAKGV